MNKKKELVKNTAILTVGKICTQFISFFLLPLYTAVLETSEYGTFDLLVSYGTLLLPIVNWQFDQGIFRFLLDNRDDKEKQKKLFSTVLIGNLIQVFIYICIMFVISRFLRKISIVFLTLYVVCHVFTALLLQFSRGIGNNRVYAISSFISATSTVVLNVVFLCVFRLGLDGLYLATIMASGITIIYMTIVLKPYEYFSFSLFDKKIFNDVKNYSLPLIPNNLAWWVVNVSDRSIISIFLGVAYNGIYTVANKFSNMFITFYNVFNLSWTESLSLHFYDEDRDIFLTDTINILFKLFSSVCFGIIAWMPFVFPYLVNAKYGEAYSQIIILMYAMLFRVFQGLYSCVYIAMKNSKKVATTSIASALINITVDIILIRFIGLYAASISTLVAFGIMAILRYFDINKYVNMKIDKKVLFSTFIIGSVLIITYYSNIMIVNIIIALLVTLYAFLINLEFLKGGLKAFKQISQR